MTRYGAAAVVLLAVVGCGGSSLAPVSGRVTLDGAPLAGAFVSFQPTDEISASPAPGSYAKTDDDGRYTLRLSTDERMGAVPGNHKVRISLVQMKPGKDDAPGPDRVPARYNKNSALTFTVPAGGTADANFELHSKE